MPTITVEALQWMQEEHESKDAQLSDLEEELELALAELSELKGKYESLRVEYDRMMYDRTSTG